MKRLITIGLSVLMLVGFSANAFAEQHWKSAVNDVVKNLLIGVEKSKTIWVDTPLDNTGELSYYPFMLTVQGAFSSSVNKQGFRTQANQLRADYFLRTRYRLIGQGIELISELTDATSNTGIAKDIVKLTSELLPPDWNERTLPDIARELVDKIQDRSDLSFRNKVHVVFEELLGGSSDADRYLSEFAITMRGYLREEIVRSKTFRLITLSQWAQGHKATPYSLKGHYQEIGSSMILKLVLVETQNGTEVANVSSRFSVSLIPSKLQVLPANVTVVAETNDPLDESADEKERPSMTPLFIWVDKQENPIYYNDDPLIVYLRPVVDLYARVYYVESSGRVCEIFPGTGDGKLIKNETMPLGELVEAPDETQFILSDYISMGYKIDQARREAWKACEQYSTSNSCKLSSWMKITDTTLGQETIKAFISSAPIDDRHVPKNYSSGAADGCVENYKDVTRGLTRGISFNNRARPANEVKIIVAVPAQN